MATNFRPCKGSYALNQFPSDVMFGMNGFHVSASGAIQGHHGPLVLIFSTPAASVSGCFTHGQLKDEEIKFENVSIYEEKSGTKRKKQIVVKVSP